MCQLAFLVIPVSRIVCFTVRCIRDSSKSLRPIGGAQVAAGNGVGRAPRNPGKRGMETEFDRTRRAGHSRKGPAVQIKKN